MKYAYSHSFRCLSLLAVFLFAPISAFTATPTLDAEQWAFLTAINTFRAQNGVGPVQVSPTLQNASQWMSDDMATKMYFSHTDSLNRDPGARMASFGYSSFTWGENIAAGYSDAQSTFNQWANSSGHRANMLNGNFTAIGIGRAYNPSAPYRWYWTTDFGGTIDGIVTPPGGGGGSPAPPTISLFTASPQNITAGQPAVLTWNVSGATSLSISNSVGSVSGLSTVLVYPSQTTTYTLTASNSGGNATATVTVTVTPAPSIDTQPPSTPAITSIAAPTSGRVDLAWTASTDNVGVTGYQVLRNGSPLGNVPASTTSYSDATVAASTTYSYAVRAFDAAGNYSASSTPAYVTTPAGATPNTLTCPAAGNGAFTGCYFSNIALSGNPAFVRTDSQINFDWGAGAPDAALPRSGYSVRWQGNFVFDGGEYTFTTTASDGIRLMIDGSSVLDAWHDQAATSYSVRQSVGQGSHMIAVEFYSRTGSASAHVSWQLNPPPTGGGRRGQTVPSISSFFATPSSITAGQTSTLSWNVTGANSVSIDNGIGSVSTSTTRSVAPTTTTTYVLTATNDSGSSTASVTVTVKAPQTDTQPPAAPVLNSPITKSATEVDLSWTAATDNVGVTGYQIVRNGSVLVTVGGETLSYADTSVSAAKSYTYAVRAIDAAGNTSQASNSVTVTTPASDADPCPTAATGAFTACYYNNLTLTGAPVLTRTDSQINFDWITGTPDRSVTPYNFSVRWKGYFDFQAGEYSFSALTSDGMRLYVDGVLIIDSWRDQSANLYTVARTLTAGTHLVTVEYYLRTGTGAAHLTWRAGNGRAAR